MLAMELDDNIFHKLQEWCFPQSVDQLQITVTKQNFYHNQNLETGGTC